MSRGRHLRSAVVISLVLFSLITLIVASIQAAEVHLAWDVLETDAEASTLTNAAGYKLYYGRAGQSYEFVLDVGKVASYTLDGLEEGQPYYITVTAYDATGVESDFSNEVTALASSTPLGTEGLVAAYSFNEGSGATVADRRCVRQWS
jgi:chitinase